MTLITRNRCVVVYENEPQLAQQSSSEQLQTIYETGFGRADSLPLNLRKLGHEVEQFIVNAAPIQIAWASENGLQIEHEAIDGAESSAAIEAPRRSFARQTKSCRA